MTLCVLSLEAFGAYRVYKLRILHYDDRKKIKGTEHLLSTLDPLQFEHYHTGYRRDRVELVDTWYCPGDTSGKKYCAKPRVKDPFAYDPRDKRPYLPYNLQPVIP